MHKSQPFYAIRVVIRNTGSGETFTRDYVRGERRMGRSAFDSYALGNMLRLVTTGTTPVTWEIHEVDFAQVTENRKFHHTTH